MSYFIRKRTVIVHLLLQMLAWQFIGVAWSCPMETAPPTHLHSTHQFQEDSHLQALPRIDEAFFKHHKESVKETSLCCDDENPCLTSHYAALTASFTAVAAKISSLGNRTFSPYKTLIKRALPPLYRPPIPALVQA